MLRTLLFVATGLFMLQNAHAQTGVKSDTLKYYFDADNLETSKENADHSLIILPKSEKDGGLYPVLEYYKNGKLKLSAFLTTQSITDNFEGIATTYYPNGNKRRIAKYHAGSLVDHTTDFLENGIKSRESVVSKTKTGYEESKITEYFPNGNTSKIFDFNIEYRKGRSTQFFPNGKVYLIREFTPTYDGDYIDCYDSTGVAMAKNGNGKLLLYTNDFKTAIKQTIVKNGIPAPWKSFTDSAAISKFDKTDPVEKVLIEMPYFDNNGISNIYSNSNHSFRSSFVYYVQDNFRYPKQELKNKTTGEVYLTMIVEKNGALSHIKVEHAISKALADEVIRVVEMSTPWHPGTLVEKKAVRSLVGLTFKFTFETDKGGKAYPNVTISFDKLNENIAIIDSLYNKSDSTFLMGNINRQPKFVGGIAAISKFVNNNFAYSAEERINPPTGKVYIQFIVEKDGHLSNIHTISGPSERIKKEGERVIRQLTDWQPGLVNDKPVRVAYTLPINFALLKPDSAVLTKPETMPQFPGGLEAFLKFLGDNIKYPREDRDNGVTGRVYITFIIEADGTLSNEEIFRAPSKTLGEEALRIVKSSPNWIPGYQDGKAVRVSYTVPINFTIENEFIYQYNNITFKDGLNN